jgi:hypothetical protein
LPVHRINTAGFEVDDMGLVSSVEI